MVNQKVLYKLNEHMGIELNAACFYWQLGAWCEHHHLEGCASFCYEQSNEERSHFEKVYKYLQKSEYYPTISPLKAPFADFKNIFEAFQLALKEEKFVTKSVMEIVNTALQEGDVTSANFMEFFVEEQHSEEHAIHSILKRAEIIGVHREESMSTHLFDQYMSNFKSN